MCSTSVKIMFTVNIHDHLTFLVFLHVFTTTFFKWMLKNCNTVPDPPKIPTANHWLRGAIEHPNKKQLRVPSWIYTCFSSDPKKPLVNISFQEYKSLIKHQHKPPTSTGCSRSAKRIHVHCTRSPLDSSHVPKVPKLRLDSPSPEPDQRWTPRPFVEFLGTLYQ